MKIISLKRPWLNAGLFVLALTALTSCLKDTGPIQDFGQTPNLITFQYKGTGQQLMVTSVPIGTDDSVNVEVTLSTPHRVLGTPITVTLAKDADSLAAYNAANGTSYTMIQDDALIFPANNEVTIPAGENISKFLIRIDQSKVDFLTDPVLVLRIVSATGGVTIASNLSVIILPIKLKNPYEGSYAVTGYFNHPSASRNIDQDKDLATISNIRSEGFVGDLGSTMQFDVNPTNDLVNFVNASADLAAPFVSICCTDNAAGNPGFPAADYNHVQYNNTYDPGTHTFWMHYGYNGSPSTREIYEKWVLIP